MTYYAFCNGCSRWGIPRFIWWLAAGEHCAAHLRRYCRLSVTRVTLKHALTSYADIAETDDYNWPLASLLPNVLAHFDMPDCYAELADRNLVQIEPATGKSGAECETRERM